MINRQAFEAMKAGVMIINCARGGIVNEADLHDAIVAGKVAGAALDVFETEPPGDSPLLGLDQVICTPHLGASTLEAQTNVAVAVARQIIDYLKNGTITNAVNVPSVTGELLTRIGPYLSLADPMGSLQAQLIRGPLKEVRIEYAGDFKGLDMTPVSTAALRGLLAPAVKDDVNFVNARAIAEARGIRVTESTTSESEDYSSLITITAVTTEMTSTVSGTIYGKKEPRIVRINSFRLELIPCGHLALIYNENQPGAIGSIGTVLGRNGINIGQMQVGEEETGSLNVIFLKTDTRIPPEVIGEIQALPPVRSVTRLDFDEHSGVDAPPGCML